MQAARADLVAMGAPKELVELYDRQLGVAEAALIPAVPRSGPPTNMVACSAVALAHALLGKPGQRGWWAKWHRLSRLLYEFATGEDAGSLSKYLRMYRDGEIKGGFGPDRPETSAG
jgi:hypothetical protein